MAAHLTSGWIVAAPILTGEFDTGSSNESEQQKLNGWLSPPWQALATWLFLYYNFRISRAFTDHVNPVYVYIKYWNCKAARSLVAGITDIGQ
jgi:hypothetical protein